MEENGRQSAASIAELLMSELGGTQLEDVYIDQDEDGTYIGLVLSDGETEYHLTFDESGVVELAQGPVEGETLQEVAAFDLTELEPPFSEDSATGD